MVIVDHDPYRENPLVAENKRLTDECEKLRTLLQKSAAANSSLESVLIRTKSELERLQGTVAVLRIQRDPGSDEAVRMLKRGLSRAQLYAAIGFSGALMSLVSYLLRLGFAHGWFGGLFN